MDGEVHLRKAQIAGLVFVPEESDSMRCAFAALLDKVAGLNKHAARTAGGVKHRAVVRFDDADNGLHDRRRGEELAAVLSALHRELHEEVFVDASENIAPGGTEGLAVENAEEVFKERVLELGVVLG